VQSSLKMAGLRLSLPASNKRLRIAGSSLVGVFARCTEKIALVPLEASPEMLRQLEEGLGVVSIQTAISGSSVVGSLVCGNSNGFILNPYASEETIKRLSPHGKIARLPGKISAAGNVILANDNAALVHPGLSSRACETISQTMGVDVVKGTIGGLKTVGMAAAATNQGLLVHPKVSEAELAVLDDHFGIPVDVGTVNFGSPLIGSGLLANSKGYFAGEETSGPELGRIEDALGYLK
jgi:translation initiation factor 6